MEQLTLEQAHEYLRKTKATVRTTEAGVVTVDVGGPSRTAIAYDWITAVTNAEALFPAPK